jgi:hypothetical protein
MARFSSDTRLVQAICDGVAEMHRRYAVHRQFDSHDLINWLDRNRNPELNDIYDLYRDCKDPEMTADQQIGKFLYDLGQLKIGERISRRRISRRTGYNRNGECKVSIWEISPRTVDGLDKAKRLFLDDEGAFPVNDEELDLLVFGEEDANLT